MFAFSVFFSTTQGANIANSGELGKRIGVAPVLAVLSDQAKPEETRFVEMVFPERTNHYGTLFGGTALNLMGKAAFVAATRYARRSVVMAASDRIDFRMPICLGQLVEFTARVERIGRSSMTVAVDAVAETLITGDRQLAMRGRFEMVAVDEHGRPTPITADPAAPL